MHASVREDLSWLEIDHHQMDLIRMLGLLLERLDNERGSLGPKINQYYSSKEALVKEEKKALDTLTWYTFQSNLLSRYTIHRATHTETRSTTVCLVRS